MAATTAQTVPAQEAGRPQPQTTVEPPGGPFLRHSQPGKGPLYNVSGSAFGALITQPLVAKPGYLARIRVQQTVTGGTGITATYGADSPYNLDSLIQLKDAFGTPLMNGPGYELIKLVSLYGLGGGALNGANDPANLPSFSAFDTAGNGGFSYALPLEFVKAYGVLSAANASLLPTLQFNLAAESAFYTAAPGGSPVVNTTVDADFYWLPEGSGSPEPPGLGTTRQWMLTQANPSVSANASTRVAFPRLGGYLDTIIMEVRDSTGARTDGFWPSRLQLYVDGVPLIDSTMDGIYDDMWCAFGGVARPTGVVAFSRKTSLSQAALGLLDTGESWLATNPGTLLEANFAPAGNGSSGPAQVNVLVGQVVPTGSLIQGLPEV